MMKKFRGLSGLETIYILLFCFVVVLAGFYGFGYTLKQTLAGGSSKMVTPGKINFENTQDLLCKNCGTIPTRTPSSNLIPTPNYTPLETVVRSNIANGEYVQTSGSSGRMEEMAYQEIPKLLSSYYRGTVATSTIKTVWEYLRAACNTTDCINTSNIFDTAFGNYYDPIDLSSDYTAILDSENIMTLSGKTSYLKILYNVQSADREDALKTSLDNYMAVLTAQPSDSVARVGSELLNLYVNDLISIMSSISYYIDDTLYDDMGVARGDIDALLTALAAYVPPDPATDKKYADKIMVFPTKNYHDMLPVSYNTDKFCSSDLDFFCTKTITCNTTTCTETPK